MFFIVKYSMVAVAFFLSTVLFLLTCLVIVRLSVNYVTQAKRFLKISQARKIMKVRIPVKNLPRKFRHVFMTHLTLRDLLDDVDVIARN